MRQANDLMNIILHILYYIMKISFKKQKYCMCQSNIYVVVENALDLEIVYDLTGLLSSGGEICSNRDRSNMWVTTGPWEFMWEKFDNLNISDEIKQEIEEWVHKNIPEGHCGGCL